VSLACQAPKLKPCVLGRLIESSPVAGCLTLHELTHGADMVVRACVDPAFHFEVSIS
jgi:hypothetical protein